MSFPKKFFKSFLNEPDSRSVTLTYDGCSKRISECRKKVSKLMFNFVVNLHDIRSGSYRYAKENASGNKYIVNVV